MDLDHLITRVVRRRDRILRDMQRLDEAADRGYPDQGSYLMLEIRLDEVKRTLRELRALRRAT